MLKNPDLDRERFARWLERQGTTACAVAQDLGWAKTTITRWLSGERELSEEKTSALARHTGLSDKVFRRCRAARKAAA